MLMKKLVVASLLMLAMVGTAPAQVSLIPLGTVKTGLFRDADPRMAEINAYDAAAKRIYVVNPTDGVLDVIDATNPSTPVDVGSVFIVNACQAAMGAACPVFLGSEPNSVAIHGNLMAVAVANAVRTDNGHAVFFELQGVNTPRFITAVEVGALPDMVTFSEDGKYALTANEGEPNTTYTIDPPGTVSIIDVARIGTSSAVRHVDFERFDNPGQRAKLEREGVRIFGPGASLSQDLEPEYIAVRNNKAYVTLQENNALAIINISSATVEKIVGLGLKDHSLDINELDASDQDGAINIRTWPVYGLYQADAIHAFAVNGRTYLIAANEGDAREYAAYVEAVRVNNASYLLDPLLFPDANLLKANAALGRLNVSKGSGDLNGDGLYDRIETFGGRSISIRDQQGNLVWDSGDMLERLSERNDGLGLNLFNTTNSANSRDNRSDDKGIEPESVAVGEVGGTLYAFVGLERDSGIVVFDLSQPEAPAFVTYAVNRKFPRNPSTGNLLTCNNVNDCGDLGPEGLTFVPAIQSPTGQALLIVSNEVSSTTTIWEVK
jgi:2',3'-cyclic-nucleotide 2'-phosphodiesterase / 3'-nucleotidase / 5'-nucleotidase